MNDIPGKESTISEKELDTSIWYFQKKERCEEEIHNLAPTANSGFAIDVSQF